MRVYPEINQSILEQAAATVGPDIALKFPYLSEWINGDRKPTVNQLAEFSKSVHIPFGFFFLKQLPEQKNTIPLFRSNSKKPHFDYSVELRETIIALKKRQDWLVEYLRSEEHPKLPFVGKFDIGDDPLVIAENIRKVLDLSPDWSRELRNKEYALKYLTEKAEDAGIYVSLSGVLGNSPKNLDPDEFKGFVLSDPMAPYIFINGKDYPASRLFTFMHELTHIWLNESVVLDIEQFQPANTAIEKLCDAVAAELLVPEKELRKAWDNLKNDRQHLLALERNFKVSKIVLARRLMDLGIYTKAQFFSFYKQYTSQFDSKKEHTENGGGSFYANQSFRVGRKFFNTVDAAAQSGRLLYTDAYKLTSLYGDTYHKFKSYLEQ